MGALEDLRSQGKLDLIGWSNVDQATVQRALELSDVAAIQNAYNIIDRDDGGVLTLAREREIAFVPFGPLGSAYKRGPVRLATDANIARVADKHGATPIQVALAWLLASYERMLLIPGTS
jgi:pyridoxine 4-dehydrogenase